MPYSTVDLVDIRDGVNKTVVNVIKLLLVTKNILQFYDRDVLYSGNKLQDGL